MRLPYNLKNWVAILTLVFALRATAGSENKSISGEIEKNVDGDTVWLDSDRFGKRWDFFSGTLGSITNRWETRGKRFKIRMVGMDAPEEHLPTSQGIVGQGTFGTQSTAYLTKLIPVGTHVSVDDQGLDKYKRTLGRVFYRNKDINLSMVKAGWAVPYIICAGELCDEDFFETENVEAYFNACESAVTLGKGIFDPEDPLEEMPFEFRLRMQNRKPDKYVGNYHTWDLYAPDEYEKVPLCSRIFFLKKKDALRLGFHYAKQSRLMLE